MTMRVLQARELSALAARGCAAASARVPVSIERLLQWAYAEEFVHLALRDGVTAEMGGLSAPALARAEAVYAVPITSSLNGGFEAARDAYVVHDAVMALGSVELMLPRECLPSFDARVFSAGAFPAPETCFTVRLPSVVFGAAIRCERPDWVEEPMLCVERRRSFYENFRPWRRHVNWIEVAFIGDAPWAVERARLVYRAWVSALAELQDVLSGRLMRFELGCELPPAMPWVT